MCGPRGSYRCADCALHSAVSQHISTCALVVAVCCCSLQNSSNLSVVVLTAAIFAGVCVRLLSTRYSAVGHFSALARSESAPIARSI